jgi:hypothetical protein
MVQNLYRKNVIVSTKSNAISHSTNGLKREIINYLIIKDSGISLLNTGMKLYTSLLCNRLNEWCEKHSQISDYQAAYRKMYGCEGEIFVLNSAIQANVSRNRKQYALFIDLSKAFDSVRHQKPWSKLQEAVISKKFLLNVQQMYANVKQSYHIYH